MQEKLITDAVVELECQCGNKMQISTKELLVTCPVCGRRYALELIMRYWDKDEPILLQVNTNANSSV